MTYSTMTASVVTVPRKPKMSPGASARPTIRMATIPIDCCTAMAKVGVRCTGWIFPNRGGSVPACPIV